MKYPADKHYNDLQPGEPIPEIEPRYDECKYRMTRMFVRRLPLVIAAMVLVWVAFYVWNPGYVSRFIVVGVLYGLALSYLIRFRLTATTKEMREKAKRELDAWGIPIPLMLKQQVYSIAVFILALQIMSVRRASSDILFMLSFYALFAGVLLVVARRKFRQPGQISCERCSYPLVGLTLPTSCPECGHAILDLSYATDRPKLRDNRILISGVLLAAFGAMTIYAKLAKPGWLYAPIPRSMLVQLAARDRDAFDQLMGTPLDPTEERSLLDAMIANRTGFEYGGSFEQGQWFGSQVRQGALSNEQLDELYASFTRCAIHAEGSSRVGEPIRLQLVVDDHELVPSGAKPRYYFAGFRIDDDPAQYERMTSPLYRNFLNKPDDAMYASRGYFPIFDWIPKQPGTHTIHARLVFAILPAASVESPIDWSKSDDQRFAAPPIWTREVELTKEIEVLP